MGSDSANRPGPNHLVEAFGRELSISSRAVHTDDYINNHQSVAPPMHVSTTFRYSAPPDKLKPAREVQFWDNTSPTAPYDSHVYSRDSAPNTTRLEAILTSLLGGPTLTYSSGLSAFHAMLVLLNPRRVAIGGGYHGCHGVLQVLNKLNGLEKLELEDEADLAKLQKGDVIHVETPLNPTGEGRNLEYYRRKADELGCYLTVDATFAPPPLLEPFKFGADLVMHSGTKYFGGHSDMLCGTLTVRPDHADKWFNTLREERLYLGSVMGSLEGWLGVRSLRTLELRVARVSSNAQHLVDWLASELKVGNNLVSDLVYKVQHASQQPEAADPNSWLRRQMPNGYGPVFSLWMKSGDLAKRLPSKLHLFAHATSLGGVESLIEWRAMTDRNIDYRVLRVSIGVEGWEDLKQDLLQGFQALKDEAGSTPNGDALEKLTLEK